MSRADKYNLVEGSIVNKLFFVASPIIVTQIFQMAYNLTDMFWLGQLSSDAVAASGTAGLFLWLSMAFFLFGRMGAEIGVSQNLGRGDKDAARSFAQNSIVIAVFLGIIVAVTFVAFHEQLIGVFGIREAHVERDAGEYLALVSMGMPMVFTTAAVTGIFNGAGNARVSLLIQGIGFSVNMVVDPLLIFTAGLGIHGAGLATIIANTVSVTLAIIMLKKHKNRPFEKMKIFIKPKKEVIKQIFRWVSPISLESGLFTILTMMVTPLVAIYGAGALAAVRVGSQIESLTWLIAGGYASALTAFTGQNFGAGKWSRIHKGFRISTWMMACWGLVVGLVLFFGGGVLFRIFVPNDPEVIELGIRFLRIFAVIQIPACLEGVAAGIFRGQGKTLPPSIASISSNILRVVLAYASVYFTDFGLSGIWVAVSISAGVRGIWIITWYLLYSREVPKGDVVQA
jgi:putative MATE family efflux protein